MQFPEACAVVRAFGLGERQLDRTQLVVAIENEVERAAVECGGLLRNSRDAPLRGHGARAALAAEFAAEQGEETGLAAAVGTDQSGTPARMQLQRDVLEQPSSAAREREVAQLQHRAIPGSRGTRILLSVRRNACARDGFAAQSAPLTPDAGATVSGA